MHAKFPKSGLSAISLLAACLLAVTVPVAAAAAVGEGDRPVPPSPGFIFDKDAYALPGSQGEAGGSRAFSRLSLRLYGGFSRVAAGDVNEGSDGYFELLESYVAAGYGTSTGGYSPMHVGYDLGADVVYQFSPALGVGIGFGYMRSAKDSLMTLTGPEDEIALTARPALSAMPVRLGLFLAVPVSEKINLTADAGGTYYAGLKLDARQRVDIDSTDWMEMSLVGRRSDISANLGFQGALGLEYLFSPKMGFFVEAVGRYAKLKNFDSVTARSQNSGLDPETTVGKLYIADYNYSKGAYSLFTIEETPPVDEPNITYREPKIDLGGFSLQAGIRIRL